MSDQPHSALAALMGPRPWLALLSFLGGVVITVPSFYFHDLLWAVIGAVFLLGGLGVLLIPLPYPR